jgi:hypothetical protein
MAADPASWCRPRTASHQRPRCATGWSTPISGNSYEKQRECRSTLSGWNAPTDRIGESSPRPRRHDATVPDQGK